MVKIYWVAAQLATFQDGLNCMKSFLLLLLLSLLLFWYRIPEDNTLIVNRQDNPEDRTSLEDL
jgi:hypothetical protein